MPIQAVEGLWVLGLTLTCNLDFQFPAMVMTHTRAKRQGQRSVFRKINGNKRTDEHDRKHHLSR